MITALFGLRPQRGSMVVLSPTVIGAALQALGTAQQHFALDGVDYKGHTLSVVFDADGSHYRYAAAPHGRKGLVLLVDGTIAASSDTLARLEVDLSPSAPWRHHHEP